MSWRELSHPHYQRLIPLRDFSLTQYELDRSRLRGSTIYQK